MRRRPSSRILIAAALSLPAAAAGQDAADASGAAFLLVPVGARATALGQAAVADGGSSEAVFWNPAGLATLSHSELAIHHARTFISKNTALAAYLVSERLGVLGVSAYLVDFGTQPSTARGLGSPIPLGQFSTKGIELLASYATDAAGPLNLGVSYKLIQFRQDCQGSCGEFGSTVGTTHAVDLGLQLAFDGGRNFILGLAVRDAGFRLQLENSDQADPLPTRVQLGAAYRVMLPTRLANGDRLDARLLIDVQEPWGEYGDPDALVGLEFGYGELIRVRTGYALVESTSRGPSVGLGVQVDRVAIDFARVFFTSGNLDEPAYLSVRLGL